MGFETTFRQYNWNNIKAAIYSKTAADVTRALSRQHRNLDDFMALLSPAAAPYLGEMAALSRQITQRRFGKTMQLYVPLYLSNECQNICTYCGFSYNNPIRRKTLTGAEIMREVEAIRAAGFEHVLLVTGEAAQTVGLDYFEKALPLITPHFAQVSMEVQPMSEAEYTALIGLGLHSVLVYQETYHEADYRKHHPKGKKSNFEYRLATPDRLGAAGIHKIGLGVLIGLEDWRTDSFFTALHLAYLQRTYWQTRYSISFPRLRPFSGGLAPKVEMSDRELVQLICAYRLLHEDLELSLSTREPEQFRNHLVQLGVTTMSAGSKTNPGGYAVDPQSLEQFEISDERSAAAIAAMIREQGYEPVWKDWEVFQP
ncbi:2-iminoacetate synthase ThiH [Chitinophaga sp.]|uniref:2-iminoacetate synthase ThiH n=1 Tax=Chitinophaga sp. TaxID=1869181 RepID=UPI0031D1B485